MIYQDNDKYVGKSIDYYGEFCEAEVALLLSVLQPDMTFVDVGANIGAMTIPAARRAGRVVAYEPQRIAYQTLCGNVSVNDLKNVTCVQAAVGDKSGTVNVPELDYTAEQNLAGLDLRHQYAGMTFTVPLVRLDDDNFERCDLIKIDVEGMEAQVVAGAAKVIATFRPYLCVEDDYEPQRAELRRAIRAAGYRLYEFAPPLYNPDNYFLNPKNLWPDAVGRNLFCVPAERDAPDFGLTEIP